MGRKLEQNHQFAAGLALLGVDEVIVKLARMGTYRKQDRPFRHLAWDCLPSRLRSPLCTPRETTLAVEALWRAVYEHNPTR